MAQAAGITTAIRQLMSRGRPAKSTSSVRLAHAELLGALVVNLPSPLYVTANADDLDGRANHLEKLFAALHAYVAVIVSDTAENIRSGALDHHYLDNLFQDLSTDAVGAIRNAAEEMREDKHWRRS